MNISCNENGIVKWEEEHELTEEDIETIQNMFGMFSDEEIAFIFSIDVDEVIKYQQMTDVDNCAVEWKEPKTLPRKTGEYHRQTLFPTNRILTDILNKHWYKVGNEYLHIVPDEDGIYVNGLKINLLPKECTMKTRFAVVNEREKVEFEKKWQMPYGYNNCPKICFNQDEAIQWIKENLGPTERKEYIVERHKAGKIETVWKIMDGHKIAGESDEEQEEHDFDEDF